MLGDGDLNDIVLRRIDSSFPDALRDQEEVERGFVSGHSVDHLFRTTDCCKSVPSVEKRIFIELDKLNRIVCPFLKLCDFYEQ
jgi:hypothetical protein